MRQSIQSSVWQAIPLLTAGDRSEAHTLARSLAAEELQMRREVKPSREYTPRPRN